MSNGTTRGESPAAVRMAAAPRSGPGRSARTGINPTTGRSYIIAHVLRVLLIKPLMAAGHERPSAVSFLRGLAARSVFLLAATVARAHLRPKRSHGGLLASAEHPLRPSPGVPRSLHARGDVGIAARAGPGGDRTPRSRLLVRPRRDDSRARDPVASASGPGRERFARRRLGSGQLHARPPVSRERPSDSPAPGSLPRSGSEGDRLPPALPSPGRDSLLEGEP